jgi:hypothetical protein
MDTTVVSFVIIIGVMVTMVVGMRSLLGDTHGHTRKALRSSDESETMTWGHEQR